MIPVLAKDPRFGVLALGLFQLTSFTPISSASMNSMFGFIGLTSSQEQNPSFVNVSKRNGKTPQFSLDIGCL